MAKKQQKSPARLSQPDNRDTPKNKPLHLPMSFDEAVEGLLNVKRPKAEEPKKQTAKKKTLGEK